eukprot:11358367-Prorocentrum_lima.AAC.1
MCIRDSSSARRWVPSTSASSSVVGMDDELERAVFVVEGDQYDDTDSDLQFPLPQTCPSFVPFVERICGQYVAAARRPTFPGVPLGRALRIRGFLACIAHQVPDGAARIISAARADSYTWWSETITNNAVVDPPLVQQFAERLAPSLPDGI